GETLCLQTVRELAAESEECNDRKDRKERAEKDQLPWRQVFRCLEQARHGEEGGHRAEFESDAHHGRRSGRRAKRGLIGQGGVSGGVVGGTSSAVSRSATWVQPSYRRDPAPETPGSR